jgi:hypothetical protein
MLRPGGKPFDGVDSERRGHGGVVALERLNDGSGGLTSEDDLMVLSVITPSYPFWPSRNSHLDDEAALRLAITRARSGTGRATTTHLEFPGYTATRRLGGSRAPISQKNGRKMPMTNISQCPFRIESTPRLISNTK